jgi:hypothetical protein
MKYTHPPAIAGLKQDVGGRDNPGNDDPDEAETNF